MGRFTFAACITWPAVITRWLTGIAVLAGLATAPAYAQDCTIRGCNERLAGEIGMRELIGDIGDTVGVAVTLHTTNNVDAFALDLGFPTVLLSYVRMDPGSLTPSPAWSLGANFIPAQNAVRLGGFASNVTPLSPGTVGSVAVVYFEVMAAGSGSFSTTGYLDDIAGYTACESVHPTTDLNSDTWGRIKALYEPGR